MKFIRFLFFALSLCITISCSRLVYFIAIPKNPHPKKLEKCDGGNCKKLVYMPMVHVAKPKFYASVKEEVLKLKKKGYVLFYEKVSIPKNEDSLSLDTLKRKLRKLIGFPLGNYTDKTSKAYPKFFRNGNYVMQSEDNSGFSYQNDIHVDLTAKQLLRKYENCYGKIKLTECDFKTDLKAHYYCDKIDRKKANYIIKDIREEFIYNYVMNSNYSKIILLYGKNHYEQLKDRFINAGFKVVKK